nr:hypothetical protein Iba_chr01eCG5760 [Ipomoea batatas]
MCLIYSEEIEVDAVMLICLYQTLVLAEVVMLCFLSHKEGICLDQMAEAWAADDHHLLPKQCSCLVLLSVRLQELFEKSQDEKELKAAVLCLRLEDDCDGHSIATGRCPPVFTPVSVKQKSALIQCYSFKLWSQSHQEGCAPWKEEVEAFQQLSLQPCFLPSQQFPLLVLVVARSHEF